MKTIQDMAREVEAYIAATDDFVGWSFASGQLERFAALVREEAQRKPLTDEENRAEFEAWHKNAYTQSLEHYGHTYKNHHTRCRWQGWLAACDIKE